MKRLTSTSIPAAVGSYSPASQVGHLIFTSGQLPINCETGKIDQPNSVEWQVEQSLKNIRSILEDNHSSMEHIIKTTVFLELSSTYSLSSWCSSNGCLSRN